MNNLIARKYAEASFNIAKKDKIIDEFISGLDSFCSKLSKNFLKEISNPAIPRNDLVEITHDIAKNLKLEPKLIDFIKIIANSRRIKLLPQIRNHFITLVKTERNIIEAQIFSSCSIDDKSLQNISFILKNKYPNKSIEISNKIKPNILGGVVIKIGWSIIDASLKKQLEDLEKEFHLVL